MREIRLYGELGRRFGRVHRFDVATPAEAVRALSANFPGFEQALLAHAPGFHVLAGKEDRADHDALAQPCGTSEAIKIVPAVAGAKGGVLKIVLGVALLAAAFFNPLAFFGGSALLTGTAAQLAASFGAALVLGGLSQMLTPTPKYTAASDEPAEKLNSYYFSGPVNTSAQGTAVPVGYGRMIVGSAVVSMGLSVEELPT